jgi:hypothetical protein
VEGNKGKGSGDEQADEDELQYRPKVEVVDDFKHGYFDCLCQLIFMVNAMYFRFV